ncbi:MAG: GAF domain-containing protein [Candidatus Latescibacteria bacterium]|nr:GAF domain-containing protein [Candidatus Latescibacterota bacterium]
MSPRKPPAEAGGLLVPLGTFAEHPGDASRQVMRLAGLYRIAQTVMHLQDLPALARAVAVAMQDYEEYEITRLGLVKGNEVILYGLTAQLRFTVGGQGLIGWVTANGKPLLVNDVSTDPRYVSEGPDDQTRSELVVPIILDDRMIGVLDLHRTLVGAFTEADLQFAESLASFLAVAIKNAELYTEVQVYANRLALVADIAAELTIPQPVTDLLENTVQTICERLGYSHASIALIEGQELVFKAHYDRPIGFRRTMLPRFRVGEEGVTGQVAATGEAIIIPDVRIHPEYIGAPDYTKSELAVPIRSGQRVLGVINVESPQLNAFTAYDRQLLQTLADQVAVGFVQEREHIIRQQQEIIRELSTPVLQVRERLLILPIIGVIDAQRARQLTEQLLRGIRANRAKVVVIDITGVPSVDATVANHLVQTVDASRLMGANVIVTGLSSEIAQTLVTIGVDLGKINAVGDLQGGIEEAERLLGYKGIMTEDKGE